ncbi:MAG TPA: MarR family winged helix-turn-helix transcriptional regulator [Solirubrobacteraceae bacterium]|nr:MarR family winged helix-turn-helix transcriptional regulator [Solirubrobacteraceae bacterium]
MAYLTAHELDICSEVRAMCTCNQLRRATRGVTQLYDAALAATGVKVTQLPILVGLGSAGDLSVTTLADALALDRTTLTRNLKVLEDRGLVRTNLREDDARVRMVSLTLEGSRVLAGALVRWAEIHRAVEERFGRERLLALYDELAALDDAVGV